MIEIPGYRIVRLLGRGGMATVYLAIQTSVDREVALKVMAPALLVDPNFGERFLREARIAAKLHHRHVVGVHDVGCVGDYHYIAMEYLPGGAVLGSDGHAREPSFALRVIREMASALAYAHGKGFVHRDLKPDNILLRDDGTSALTDFGIARATDSATRMTRTGAVIGTPHYMSPEQARGKPIDGRADLYSLGIVLYELLTGRVPYQADDSLAVGIMHITEPLPRLPAALSDLQGLLDGFLEKLPEGRFQNGGQVVNAIRTIEQRMLRGELPKLGPLSSSTRERMIADLAESASRTSNPPETRTPKPQPETTAMAQPGRRSDPEPGSRRMDPQMGDFSAIAGEIHQRGRSVPRPASAPGRRSLPLAAIAAFVIGIGGAALWFNQERLRALIPESQTTRLLRAADQALHDGKINGPDSARELYSAVLKGDPDNDAARIGIKHVGEELVAAAQRALNAGDLPGAREKALAAREILQGGAMLDALEAALSQADTRLVKVNDFLEKALAAQREQKFDDPESGAIALYRRVLDADPENAIAQNGVRQIAGLLTERATAAIDSGKKDEAQALIEALTKLSPDHVALPALRAKLSDQGKLNVVTKDAQLARAEALLRAGALVSPAGASAADAFRAVLVVDPGNDRARAGLARIGSTLLTQAQASLDVSDTASAARQIAEAEALGASSGELNAAKSRLRELREKIDVALAHPVVSADQQARLEKNLADAEFALTAGNLFDPPGGNAYDLYRTALGIDRDNAKAKQGLAALPQKARSAFEQALKENRPNTARSYLEGLDSIASDDPQSAVRHAQLAQVYVKLADQQIVDKQLEAAAKSLLKAREVSADEPSIAAGEARLASARGGS